jgi:AcrR family transcriptional regulator
LAPLGVVRQEREDGAARELGRPRDPEISEAILSATLDLLNRKGYARLTIGDVARRAGVHRPAVYRRWANKLDLAVAAIQHLAPNMRDPKSGDVRTDLVEILLDAGAKAHDQKQFATAVRLRAELAAEPELAAAVETEVVAPRRAIAHTALERAAKAGQLRADLDFELAIDMLFAPLTTRALRAPGVRLRRREAAHIVDQFIDGLTPGQRRTRP